MSETEPLAKGARGNPPLPENSRHPADKPVLPDGCYFIALGDTVMRYWGTLRVESRDGQVFASGDLYAFDLVQTVGQVSPPAPGIPIFPIADYTYYLRVTQIEPADPGFALTFEALRYFPKDVTMINGDALPHWVLEGAFTASMMPAKPPTGFPQPDKFFLGDVAVGDHVPPQLQMGWVAPLLRRAVIEVDCVPNTHAPLDNGAGVTWQKVFNSFNWDITAIDSNHDITKSSSEPWTTNDADSAMRQNRGNNDLDAEWRYYVLIASLIHAPGEADGFMYHQRREAMFVAAQSTFPDQPQFGTLRGQCLDTTIAFLRTVMHEMGHAMGLGHNDTGFHFMRPTPSIAQDSTADNPFPGNIDWSFHPDDAHRLRHWPDIAVRPGGAPVGAGNEVALPGAPRT
jgi:hypothetical protein